MMPTPAVPAARHLLMLGCSQRKHAGGQALPALDLYQGVMYQTLRVHADPLARPQLAILSAEHGFLRPQDSIHTYDRRMDARRADALLADLPALVARLTVLEDIEAVQLCGGAAYRRVMVAAVDELKRLGRIHPAASVTACVGQLGEQRAQLGAYLRGLSRASAVRTSEPNETCQLQLTSKAQLTSSPVSPDAAQAA